MMYKAGRGCMGLVLAWTLGLSGAQAWAQTQPAVQRPAATGAAAPAATKSATGKPTVDDLLPRQAAPFDFVDTPIIDIIKYTEKTYGVTFNNQYDLRDRITMKMGEP